MSNLTITAKLNMGGGHFETWTNGGFDPAEMVKKYTAKCVLTDPDEQLGTVRFYIDSGYTFKSYTTNSGLTLKDSGKGYVYFPFDDVFELSKEEFKLGGTEVTTTGSGVKESNKTSKNESVNKTSAFDSDEMLDDTGSTSSNSEGR